MADPTTTNLNLSLPVVNADADTWGTTLNADLTAIDTWAGECGTPQDAAFSAAGVSAGSWSQAASLALTPGTYELSALVSGSVGGTDEWFEMAVSTTSASASGATMGESQAYILHDPSSGVYSGALTPFVVTVSANTTYYLNLQAQVGGVSLMGHFHAKRIL